MSDFLVRPAATLTTHRWSFTCHNRVVRSSDFAGVEKRSQPCNTGIYRLCELWPTALRFVIVPISGYSHSRHYNIMRPLSFRSDTLRAFLLRNQIATLGELKHALGTSVDVTVFRKLKPMDYITSYSHRGRYYTLREIARFNDHGLWSQADVCFSRFGTLL